MLVAILIVLNIPVYLFLGWVVFDDRHKAEKTFVETIVDVLKILFIPRIVRLLAGTDTTGAIGCLPISAYFIACGFLTYGEYWLLTKFVFTS